MLPSKVDHEGTPCSCARLESAVRRWPSVLFTVEVLALAIWLGGMVAIALVAPVIFQTVQSRDLAGRIFGEILTRLYVLIYVCGGILILTGLWQALVSHRFSRIEALRYGLVALMLALAVYSGTVILSEMASIQAALPAPIETLPDDDPARTRFNELHKLSERLMGIDVALGLLALPLFLARQGARRNFLSS